MLLQWLQKSLSPEQPGWLWKELAAYQGPSLNKGDSQGTLPFSRSTLEAQGQIEGPLNELVLTNPTCQTEENLEFPKI